MKLPVLPRLHRGFTLLEALLVVMVLAISLAIGLPSFSRLVAELRLEHASRALLGAIHYARHEAIMRDSVVSLCPSRMWHTGEARCAEDYTGGWIVFVNPDRNAQIDPPDEAVLRVFDALPPGYTVKNRRATSTVSGIINYLPDGTAHRNLTLQVCPPDGTRVESVSVVLNIVGRARLDRNWGQCQFVA